MKDQHNNNIKRPKSLKENNSIDLWSFQAQKQLEINTNEAGGEARQVQSYSSSKYKPQLSVPTKSKKTHDNHINVINQSKFEINTNKPPPKQSSVPRKKVGNISLGRIDYNPDGMVKFIKNKFQESNSQQQPNCDSSTRGNKKKINKEIEAIGTSLYQKKVLSNDYEMQKQIKKVADEEKTKQELSQCTFKPKLYSNQNYDKNKMQKEKEIKRNIYELQNKWLDQINSKNEKNFEKKINKELRDCSFVPKTTKMPNFIAANIKYENETNELYYMRIKNARKATQEKQEAVNYAKNYDNRRKKNGKSSSVGNIDININNKNNYIEKNVALPQEGVNINNEYEKKKNMLMQDLHGWNFDNTEADDDFF